MSLMEQFANPQTFESLSLGEKLTGAGVTTLMGMGTTFVILLLLWGIIVLLGKLAQAVDSRKNKKAEAKTTKAPATAPAAAVAAPVAAASENLADDSELVAVIMAAIAASSGDGATSNLIIRKINRLSGQGTTWNSAGRTECINSRRI